MKPGHRPAGHRMTLAVVALGVAAATTFAQRAERRPPGHASDGGVDFSGFWALRFHEDQPERVPGPELGDYLGLPINDAARLRAQTFDASWLTLPEWQCRPHPADYIWRGASPPQISREIDPVSRQTVAFHAEWLRSVDRAVYLDGRPHPSPHAPHTWAGFSTGRWEGDVLRVRTTHLKEAFIRRNGVPRSDRATLSEHWIRHGDILTVATIIYDPVYLTEPFIRTTDFELDLHQQLPPYPCEVVEEVDRPAGSVPHKLPGTEPEVEFARKHNLPVAAARGGAETMYPDFRYQAGLLPRPAPAPATTPPAAARPPLIGPQRRGPAPQSARARAAADLTGSWVSVVTEDWRWRMVTPPRGDYPSIPLTAEGRRVADAWDPTKDDVNGEACRAYGAPGVMRLPGRLRITWADDNTLRIDTEAGSQTRLLHFAEPPSELPPPSWQGYSTAEWIYPGGRRQGPPGQHGALKVVTTRLKPGYLQKNGVPYSDRAVLTEYFHRVFEDNGDSWLIVIAVVEDPQYLTQRFLRSSHFKQVADTTPWNPTPCWSR